MQRPSFRLHRAMTAPHPPEPRDTPDPRPVRTAGVAQPARRHRARLARGVSAAITTLVLLPIAAGLVGIILPAFSFMPPLGRTELSLAAFAALADEPGVVRSALLSAWTGLAATLISVALTLALLCAAYGTRALARTERLLAPILAIPHAAAALAVVVLIAPSGFVLRALSPWATGFTAPPDVLILRDPYGLSLILALVIKEVPFLFLLTLAALPQARAAEHAALARTLGYGRMAAVLFTVWPLVYRRIRLPVLAVLVFAATVVDVALILGPTRPPPLAVRILSWLNSPDPNQWLVGCAASTALCGLCVALVALWLAGEWLMRPLAARMRLSGARFAFDGAARAIVLLAATAVVALLAVGFVGVMVQAGAGYWPFPETLPSTFSLSPWLDRWDSAGGVLIQTLAIALGATLVTLPAALALLEADRHGARLSVLLYAPLIAPQVAFLFGLSVIAIATGITPGVLAVIAAHSLFTLPYVLIALAGPWRSLDPRFERAATALGAGPWRRFILVRVPLLLAPLLAAAALCVAVSVALYLPTQLIGGGRVATVTTEAVAASAGGDRRAIGLWVALQLLIPMIAFMLARIIPASVFAQRRAMRAARLCA